MNDSNGHPLIAGNKYRLRTWFGVHLDEDHSLDVKFLEEVDGSIHLLPESPMICDTCQELGKIILPTDGYPTRIDLEPVDSEFY